MSTFSNENHVTRGFTSDAINEFAFRLISPAQANRKFPVQLYVKIQIIFEPPF